MAVARSYLTFRRAGIWDFKGYIVKIISGWKWKSIVCEQQFPKYSSSSQVQGVSCACLYQTLDPGHLGFYKTNTLWLLRRAVYTPT